ncbi:adenylyl-sulfate kinase [Pseudomonas poae]|nr:adenylyl-sulfate kinase [Pseudomonas poae]
MHNGNLTHVPHALTKSDRKAHYGHSGAVLWLTGLSASGKSTLSMGLEAALTRLGFSCYVLDGDNVRKGLNSNLGFSAADRTENIRRVAEVAALFSDAGLICITAFISPYRKDRAKARHLIGSEFHEVYVAADLACCEARDPKGLYKKARSGDLHDFTGISAPYERPESPELTLNTGGESYEDSLNVLLDYVLTQLPLKKTR